MEGWTCPRCHRVWSPDIKKCEPCNEAVAENTKKITDMLLVAGMGEGENVLLKNVGLKE